MNIEKTIMKIFSFLIKAGIVFILLLFLGCVGTLIGTETDSKETNVEEVKEENDNSIKIYGEENSESSVIVDFHDTNGNIIDTKIGYIVPAGTYLIENPTDYSNQINIYSLEMKYDGGYEYPADTFIYMIDKHSSEEIYIPENYYIYITKYNATNNSGYIILTPVENK